MFVANVVPCNSRMLVALVLLVVLIPVLIKKITNFNSLNSGQSRAVNLRKEDKKLTPTTMADLFTAADISGLQGNVGTLLLGFIAIGLLFTGMKYLRKSGIRA